MLASTVFCASVRQVPSRAPLQLGTSVFRLKADWQAWMSDTMPSVAPSRASHLAVMRAPSSLNSAAVTAEVMSGWPASAPEATLAGAMLAYCCTFHS